MAIDPTKSGSPRGAGADGRSGRQGPKSKQPDARPRPSPAPRSNEVEISSNANEMRGRGRPEGVRALPPERLREVLSRLSTGFYDRPEVIDVVARQVLGDLGKSIGR